MPEHVTQTKRGRYLLKRIADPVIDPDDLAGNGWQALPEEEVRRKNADEREVLLTTEAHDSEGSLNTSSEILVLRALHPGNLMCMLCQRIKQLVLFAASLCNVALHSHGHCR